MRMTRRPTVLASAQHRDPPFDPATSCRSRMVATRSLLRGPAPVVGACVIYIQYRTMRGPHVEPAHAPVDKFHQVLGSPRQGGGACAHPVRGEVRWQHVLGGVQIHSRRWLTWLHAGNENHSLRTREGGGGIRHHRAYGASQNIYTKLF